MKRTLLLGGGVFRCAFQLPIIRKLVCEQVYDYVCCVGLGAFNGAMVATGKVGQLQACWEHGLLSRRWYWPFGLYTHDRLKGLLYQHVDPSRLGSELQCGSVVLEGFKYSQSSSTTTSGRRSMHDQVMASCSTAGVVEPMVRSGETLIDGSHLMGLPKIPFDSTNVDVILTQPIGDALTVFDTDKQLAVLAGQLHRNTMASLEFLRQWKRHPANSLTVYAPREPLGGMLDDSRKSFEMRLRAGEEAAKRPVEI